VDADNLSQEIPGWKYEEILPDAQGNKRYRIFRTEYSGILTGNFGKSYQFRKPVMELVADRIPISAQFGLISFILSYTVCVYLGIQKALRHNSFFDFITSSVVFVAYSVPGWALGAVLLVFFCTQIRRLLVF
jgi:microcin C transport system permease protein